MKTSRFLIFSLFILVITSCSKVENEAYDFENTNTKTVQATNANGIPSLFGPTTNTLKLIIKRAARETALGQFGSNAMVVHNDLIWSVGGVRRTTGFETTNEVWSSNDGVNWALVTEGRFPKQRGHTLTIFNNEMWLIGKGIWKSNDGITWQHMVKTPPFGNIQSHNTLVFQEKIYVIKGSSVWSSDNGTDWRLETDRAFSHRNFHSAVVFNGAMYVMGGSTGLADTPYNTIWKSTNGSNWTRLNTISQTFSARSSHTSTVYNNKVFVIGGTVEGYDWSKEIWYTSDMITWQAYQGNIPFSRLSSHQSLVFNNHLWNFGGWRDPTGISGEIWKIAELD